MSRSISKRGDGPHLGVVACSRERCERKLELPDTAELLDQELLSSTSSDFKLAPDERRRRMALRAHQFAVLWRYELPAPWLTVRRLDTEYTPSPHYAVDFCSWRCLRLYAAGAEKAV